MKLIVGLGNPGIEYCNTRHNVGYAVVDKIAAGLSLPPFKLVKKFDAEISEALIHKQKVILAKPLTFMNLSGKAVAALASYYKIKPSDIWVVADELDLPLGTLRVKPDTVSSTHNGIRNIIQTLGNSEFIRFRLGINTKSNIPADQFVLAKFPPREKEIVDQAVDKTAQIIINFLEEGRVKAETIDLAE